MNKTALYLGLAVLGYAVWNGSQNNSSPQPSNTQPYTPYPSYPSTQTPYTPPNGGGLVDDVEAVLDSITDVIESADDLFGGDKDKPVQDQARPQYYDAYQDTGLPNDTIA